MNRTAYDVTVLDDVAEDDEFLIEINVLLGVETGLGALRGNEPLDEMVQLYSQVRKNLQV